MGSAPMLIMMVAAVGVTYGWQPDPQGDDDSSVQYIIQVSPYELDRIRQVGEITTLIDPVVQGHVSRIVVRVGGQDLPRKLPDSLKQSQRVASLKPDPQSGGFSLPPSLQNAADQLIDSASESASNSLDQMGRRLERQVRGQLNQASDRGTFSPPSTRLDSSKSAFPNAPFATTPDFATSNSASNNSGSRVAGGGLTGGAGLTGNQGRSSTTAPFVGGRANGPSTSSVDRTNTWNFGPASERPTVNTASNRSGRLNGPSTSDRSRLSPTGLKPNDQFGRTPGSSFGTPTINSPFRTANNSPQDRLLATNRGQAMTQLEQVRLDRERSKLSMQNSPSRQNSLTGSTQSPDSSFSRNRSSSNMLPNSSALTTQPQALQASSSPKPRLTVAQMAAGGVDFDRYNRLIDRNGALVRDPELMVASAREIQSQDSMRQQWAEERHPSSQAMDRNRMMASEIGNSSRYADEILRVPTDLSSKRVTTVSDPRDDANRREPLGRSRGFESASDEYRLGQLDAARRSPEYADRRYRLATSSRGNNDSFGNVYQGMDQRRTRNEQAARYDQREHAMNSGAPAPSSAVDEHASSSDHVASHNAQMMPDLGLNPQRTSVQGNTSRTKSSSRLSSWFLVTSFVVNLFFLYWFHGMRQRYRELVIAKRMVDSAAATAS